MNSHLPLHFYVTVSHPSGRGIRISSRFMERHGETLGDSVFLTDSGSGETDWKVELRAVDSETWLGKGWKEFMDFYSIKEEYLLMFKYQGHSRFLVTVFDKYNNEIPYPVDPRRQIIKIESEPEPEPEEDFVTVPVKKKVAARKTGGNGRRRRNGRDSDGNSEKRTRAPRPRAVRTYSRRSGTKKKIRACERVFKSENPFFSIFIQPSHNSANYIACVPHKFWTSHFTGKETGEKGLKFAIRVAGEKKKWPVLLKDCKGSGKFRGSGWRQFAKQNDLTVGEVCIFELVKKKKVFNVFRFK